MPHPTLRPTTRSWILLTAILTTSAATPATEPTPSTPDFPDPDAPAIVLTDDHHWHLVPFRRADYQHSKRIRILNRKGLDHADQQLYYDAADSRLESFSAQTVQPDGTVVPLPDSLKHERVLIKRDDMEIRLLQFTFPAVQVGSVLEWSYRIHEGEPAFWRDWDPQDTIPVRKSRLRVEVKQPVELRNLGIFAIPRAADNTWCETVEEKSGTRKKNLEMVCRDVPAFVEEPFSPPEKDLRVSYHIRVGFERYARRIWGQVKTMLSERIDEFTRSRKRVRKLVAELKTEGMTDSDKVDAVYDYVKTNLDIRPESLGGPKLEQSVDGVLASGGGTPDQITMVTMVLLEACGLEVDPIAVKDRTEGLLHKEIPELPDHLMLRVEVDGETSFLDPSCAYCQAGFVGWRYSSNEPMGIVSLPGSAHSGVTIGTVSSKYNSENHKEEVTLTADGEATVKGTVTWSGEFDLLRRERWEDLSDGARERDFLRSMPDEAELIDLEISDPEAFTETLIATYEVRRSGLPSASDGRLLIRPPDVFSKMLPIPMQEERHHDLWLPFGFAIRKQATFTLPEGYRLISMRTEEERFSELGLKFRQQWKSGKPGELTWIGLLDVERTEIAQVAYPQARDFARKLRLALRGGAIIGPDAGIGIARSAE